MWLLYLVPKNLLSFLVGRLAHIRWPKPLGPWTVQCFIKFYKVQMEEAEKDSYPSIGELFTRRLKPGVRPLSAESYVHPVDGHISSFHRIEGDDLIQAKGKFYSLKTFIGGSEGELSALEGGVALTYYLCPTDYHRVHSPVEGQIEFCRYIPGRLWPVNPWGVDHISQIFAINERVIMGLKTRRGFLTVVMVGATNVGRITLSFEPRIVTNHKHFRHSDEMVYAPPRFIEKGEELGVFNMGSTVIVLASEGVAEEMTLSGGAGVTGEAGVVGEAGVTGAAGQNILSQMEAEGLLDKGILKAPLPVRLGESWAVR